MPISFRVLALTAALSLLAGAAGASAPPKCFDTAHGSPPRPPPWATIPEEATVTRTTVHVRCPAESWPRCSFTAELAITSSSGKQEILRGEGQLALEGRPAGTHSRLPAGCGREPDKPIFLRHYWIASAGMSYSGVIDVGSGQKGPLFVTLEAPRGYDMTIALGRSTVEGDSGKLTHHIDAREHLGGLTITRTIAPHPLRAGGPFLAAGGSFLLGAATRGEAKLPARPRLRAGYEMARPSWLIESIAVETDLRSLVLVPTVEAAVSGNWSQVLAIGAGVPVRLIDHNTVGVRGQVAIQFPVLGVVQTFDWYPALGGRERFQMSVMGQLSL